MTQIPREEMAAQSGRKFPPGTWITVDQQRIDVFADCTEDQQFIHVNPEKATQTNLGGTIAHGFLTLSLLAKMAQEQGIVPEGMVMGLNYGLDKVRFLTPVRAGKRIRSHAEVISAEAASENRYLIKQKFTVEIEGEETPAMVAETLLMAIVE